MMTVPSLFVLCKNFVVSALERLKVWDKVTSLEDPFLLECAILQSNLSERQEFLLQLNKPSNYVQLQSYISEDENEDENDEFYDDRFYLYEDDFALVNDDYDDYIYDD